MTGKCQEQVIYGFRSEKDGSWEGSFWDDAILIKIS